MRVTLRAQSARCASVVSVCTLSVTILSCFPERITVNAPDVRYVSVSTADAHACGLTDDGEVYCWSPTDPRPLLVSGQVRLTSVSTFDSHTCGIADGGSAYCWGFNHVAQLGIQNAPEQCRLSFTGALLPCSRSPMLVSDSLVFTVISVGGGHTCALDPDGVAFCWGFSAGGRLGTAEESLCQPNGAVEPLPCSFLPLRVAGDLRLASISASRAHTCGVTVEGDAYCWGIGGSGRLGNGTLNDSPTPSLVSGDLEFETVSAGGSHTCGVTTDNVVFCWGANSDLQLGSLAAELNCATNLLFRCVATPHPVDGDLLFKQVTASNAPPFGGGPLIGGHTCGLTTDDDLYCWGLNESGQLLLAGEFRSATPNLIEVEQPFVQINAGLINTCGTTTDGAVRCWAFGSPWGRWRERAN